MKRKAIIDDELPTTSVLDNVLGRHVPRRKRLGHRPGPARNEHGDGDGKGDDADASGSYPAHVSVDLACTIVGGDRPISAATYYRGVKRGIFPAPFHPSPGIARVKTAKLLAAIEDAMKG